MTESLLAAMSEASYVVDRDRRITYWSPAAELLTGHAAQDVVGRRCRDGILNHVDDAGHVLCRTRCPLLATMRDGLVKECSVFLHHHDGQRMRVAIKAAPLRAEDGSIIGAVEVFHDDAHCAGLEARYRDAEERASRDDLTGLANRWTVQRQAEALDAGFIRHQLPYAVLFLDIDHFKTVNDMYGHTAGDAVLRAVAATLQACVRSSDLVGRWGGEEFLVLAPVRDPEEALVLAERARHLVKRAWVQLGSTRTAVTVSVGVAVVEPGEAPAHLVRRADQAMYTAKELGRDRVELA